MDDDRIELIQWLCTEAGMIMEGMSALAIGLRVPADVPPVAELLTLTAACDDMRALIAAATVVARRNG